MSNPSYNSWNCEKHWVHVSWETHGSVNQTTVKVNIWIQFSCNANYKQKGTKIRPKERFFQVQEQSQSKAISRKFRKLRRQSELYERTTFLTILALGS